MRRREFAALGLIGVVSVLSIAFWGWPAVIALLLSFSLAAFAIAIDGRASIQAVRQTSRHWHIADIMNKQIKLFFGLGVVLLVAAVIVHQRAAISNMVHTFQWAFEVSEPQ